MASSSNTESWKKTFPDHPDDNPSAFFHRLTILAISNYCHGRKILPPQCFKKRVIESHELYTFQRDVVGGGNELTDAVLQLKHVFTTKTVSTVIFMVCGTSVDDPIESLYFNFSFGPLLQPSQVTKEETLAKIKEDTFKELHHLKAIAQALPSLSVPLLKFQLRYELNDSGKENAPMHESFVPIHVNPNVHKLYGVGADDLAIGMKLSRGESINVWLHSKLIKSISEIDSQIAEYERIGLADETISDMNSTLNVD